MPPESSKSTSFGENLPTLASIELSRPGQDEVQLGTEEKQVQAAF